MITRIALTATAFVSAAAPAAPAGFTLDMAGHVPTLCRVEVSPEAGTLGEFCNAVHGYEVYAESSEDGAVLIVDGREVRLAAGPTLVSRSDHADIATRSIALRGKLTFRIVPL